VVFKEMWRINLLQLPFFSLSHMSMWFIMFWGSFSYSYIIILW
jgi:hypothetical protein